MNIRNSVLRTAVLGTAIGLAALVGGKKAIADPILVDTQPWTSWSQLYNSGSNTGTVSNNGDFSVDGSLPTDVKAGAGLLRDGAIIGYVENFWEVGFGEYVSGAINVDPLSTTNPNALGPGQRANGVYNTVDVDGSGDWGFLNFWSNGAIDVHADEGELILNQDGFLYKDTRANAAEFPRYLGSVDGMENGGVFEKYEIDTDYAVTSDVQIPGDTNGDGKVDGADLALWQQNYDPLGEDGCANTIARGDWNKDNKIDGADLALWQQNYDPLGPSGSSLASDAGMTAIPEPSSIALFALGILAFARRKRRS